MRCLGRTPGHMSAPQGGPPQGTCGGQLLGIGLGGEPVIRCYVGSSEAAKPGLRQYPDIMRSLRATQGTAPCSWNHWSSPSNVGRVDCDDPAAPLAHRDVFRTVRSVCSVSPHPSSCPLPP